MAVLAVYPQACRLHLALAEQDLQVSTEIALTNPPSPQLYEAILNWLKTAPLQAGSLDFIVCSGLLLPADQSGLYLLNKAFLASGPGSGRAPNQGPRIARHLAEILGVTAYVVDPWVGGESLPLAAVTGTPSLPRNLFGDIFVFKHLAREEARQRKIPLETSRFVVANLNEEFQIGAVLGARVLDLTNSQDEGSFSLQQAGSLPFGPLLELSARLGSKEKTLQVVEKESGVRGYLGLTGFPELFQRKDPQARLIAEALAYQIGKEIGAYAAVLKGRTDAIVLSGSLIQEKAFLTLLEKRVGFLGEQALYPGNQALPALIAGAARIKEQKEPVLSWKGEGADGIFNSESEA